MQLPQPAERVNVIFGHVCRVTSSQQRERIQVGLPVSFITVLCVCVRTHTHGWAWTDSPKRWCKTQNSGLRSKEEKPRDPINQPSRCNTQEGLLSVAQTGDSDLLGGRAHRTANWASFICNILHTGCKVIGYTFAKQSYWYKLRGLHVYKAILLAQTSWAFVQI